MSPVVFSDAVVEPSAVFKFDGVDFAGGAGVVVNVVVVFAGIVRAGVVVHLAVVFLFAAVYVWGRSGERNGRDGTGGREESKEGEQNPTEAV